MLKLIKILIATMLLLSTLTALCIPTLAATFPDVAETHWAYASVDKISEKGLMIGRGTPNGVVFDPNGYITGFEIYETLYRIAEGQYSDDNYSGKFTMRETHLNKWFSDSYEWAAKNGVAELTYTTSEMSPGDNDYSFHINYARHGNPTSFMWFDDSDIPDELRGTFSGYNGENPATRTDVILSLYFYMTTYLGTEVAESVDLSVFTDWNYDDFEPDSNISPERHRVSLPNYNRVVYNVYYKEFVSAWEWAVGSGIIKGCGDGTLRHINSADGQFYHITRAEYATILDRFASYLETVK